MTNRYIKKVPYYFVKEGSLLNHELYGKGEVVASYPQEGYVDLRFADGHIESGYDIKDQVMPEVFDVEAFKCPVTGAEILAERCACLNDGIKACSYYHADLEKQESSCMYEDMMKHEACEKAERQKALKDAEDKAISDMKALYDEIGENLKKASFEDVLGNVKANNINKAVKHKVTGSHGEIEKQVSDNAVLVNWKNQEGCLCQTVVTNTEIEPDADAKIMQKICDLREKFKKKFIKPINDFFKSKKAAVEETLYKVDAEKVLKALAFKSPEAKAMFLKALQAQLNSVGVEVEPSSITLNDKGEATSFTVIKANNKELFLEELPIKQANEKIKDLGYEGDVLKVYASLKGQSEILNNEKTPIDTMFVDEEELKSLF